GERRDHRLRARRCRPRRPRPCHGARAPRSRARRARPLPLQPGAQRLQVVPDRARARVRTLARGLRPLLLHRDVLQPLRPEHARRRPGACALPRRGAPPPARRQLRGLRPGDRARVAGGARLPFSYCLIFHPVISVMTALPVSVNGVGVREGGYLYFLTRIDIDDSIAVTLSLLAFGVTVVAGLLGGVVFLVSGATLPTLRAPASKEAGVAA